MKGVKTSLAVTVKQDKRIRRENENKKITIT